MRTRSKMTFSSRLSFLSSMRAMASSSTVISLLLSSLASCGDRFAAEVVLQAVPQQDFVVDVLVFFALSSASLEILRRKKRAPASLDTGIVCPLARAAFQNRLHLPLGFLQAIIEIVIGRLLRRDQGDLDRVGMREEAGRPHRFEANARMLVVGQALEQFEGVGNLLALIAQDARCRRPGPRIRRRQHLLQQIAIGDVVILMDPQALRACCARNPDRSCRAWRSIRSSRRSRRPSCVEPSSSRAR